MTPPIQRPGRARQEDGDDVRVAPVTNRTAPNDRISAKTAMGLSDR